MTLLQRCQACRSVLHPCQRFVPALFSCPRDHTVLGIGQVLVPTGPLRFIARFVQRSCPRLALDVLWCGHRLQCLQGGVDTSRLEGLQPGRCDGAIHPEPADRSARGGAAIHPAPAAHLPGHPTSGAPRGDRELTPTPATTE